MDLTLGDIDHIAHLAQLDLDSGAREALRKQLSAFFGLVQTMRAVDTEGIEPLAQPLAAIEDVPLRLRDDVATEPNQRDANQRSAPAVEQGLFLVPRVIE
jgi:aspartyl-tRNA(Asn)/glutamyl-tRNA(Gln) amidotransferase subunit C